MEPDKSSTPFNIFCMDSSTSDRLFVASTKIIQLCKRCP